MIKTAIGLFYLPLRFFKLKANESILSLLYLFSFLCGFNGFFLIVLGDTLFLLTYPPEWVSYLFLIGMPLRIAFSFLMQVILPRLNLDRNKFLLFLFFTLIALFLPTEAFGFWWHTFAYVVAFNSIWVYLAIINSNVATMNLTFQRSKETTATLAAFLSFGAIAITTLFPIIFYHFGKIGAIFMLICSFGAMVLLFLQINRPKLESDEKEKSIIAPLKSSMGRITLTMAPIVVSVAAFAEYSFKNELALSVSKEQFALYISWAQTSIWVFLILMYSWAIPSFLKNFGLSAFALSLPMFVGIAAAIYFIFPKLPSAVVLYIIAIICWDLFNFMIELFLNALSPALRDSTRMWVRALFVPLGFVLSALFIIKVSSLEIFDKINSLRMLGLISTLLALPWLLLSIKIVRDYRKHLKKSLFSHFFRRDQIDAICKYYGDNDLSKTISTLLSSSKPSAIVLGLSLIKQAQMITPLIQETLEKNILTYSDDLALMACRIVKARGVKLKVKKLAEYLSDFSSQELIWHLLQIVESDPEESAVSLLAERWVAEGSYRSLYGEFINSALLKKSTPQHLLNIVIQEHCSRGSKKRFAIAHLLELLSFPERENILKSFIADSDNSVVSAVQKIIASEKIVNLLPDLVESIAQSRNKFFITEQIASFGGVAVDHLTALIETPKTSTRYAVIKTLLAISEERAEKAVIALANHPSVVVRWLLAKELLKVEHYRKFCTAYKNHFLQIAEDELERRYYFQSIAHSAGLSAAIRREGEAQLSYVETCCLAWYALSVDSEDARDSVETLISPVTKSEEQLDKALDLLAMAVSHIPSRRVINRWRTIEAPAITMSEIRASPFCDPFLGALAKQK